MTSLDTLPVAVIGAGPVGLAAAAHLIRRGLPVKVYEAGATVSANVAAVARLVVNRGDVRRSTRESSIR